MNRKLIAQKQYGLFLKTGDYRHLTVCKRISGFVSDKKPRYVEYHTNIPINSPKLGLYRDSYKDTTRNLTEKRRIYHSLTSEKARERGIVRWAFEEAHRTVVKQKAPDKLKRIWENYEEKSPISEDERLDKMIAEMRRS